MAGDPTFGSLDALSREATRLIPRLRESLANAELLERRLGSGGAGGGGRVPPTGVGGAAGAGDPQYPRKIEGATRATRGLSSETKYLVQQEALASDQLRRYGALSTEFINEAARGRVTIRELGLQVRDTIGKFGGWVAAGGAVYGVLGALTQVGQGAIETDRGVAEMQRTIDNLDSDQARRDLRGLSEEFNLPVEEVAAAAGEMGKVFHDQNQALEATRAVLYGVRTGELDVATSSRYLISIIQGFQLPASEMGTVLDQINEAQNRFGADIPTTFAGIARAAGIAKAAGADFDYILGLVTTGAKATGQSGNVVGTAIQRIPGQLRQPANKQFLKSLGIDPNQEMQAVIEEAFETAQKLSGEELQQLGSAIAGKQYGPRIFTPILQQYGLMQEVLRDTSPQAAAGSAHEELQTILGADVELLKSIISQLEIFGSNAEQAGFLKGLELGAGALQQMLVFANNLLEIFNSMPGPLRETVSYAIQLRLLLALMRRFQVGEFIAGGPTGQPGAARRGVAGFFQPQGGRAEAGYVATGLARERDFLEQQRVRATSEAARSSFAKDVAVRRGANKAQIDALTERRDIAKLDADVAREQIRANTEAQRAIRGRFGRVDRQKAVAYAERTGAYVPTTYERETTARPGQVRPSGLILPPPRGVKGEQNLARAEGDMAAAERQATRTTGRFRNLTGRAAAAGGAMGRAASALVGKIGVIAFGAFAFFTAMNFLKDQAKAIADRADAISSGVSNQKEAEAKLKKLASEAEAGASFAEGLGDFLTLSGAFEPVGDALDFLGGTVPIIPDVFGGLGGEGFAEERREKAGIAQRAFEERQRQQDEARLTGKPIPRRFVSDIAIEIPKVQKQAKTRQDLREEIARLDEALAQSERGLVKDPRKNEKELEEARQKLRDARLTSAPDDNLFRSLLKVGDIGEYTKLIEEQIGTLSLGFSPEELARAADAFNAARVRLVSDRSPESVAAFQEAREAYFENIPNLIREDLEDDLSLARSPGAKAQAYDQARTRYKQLLGRNQARLDDQRGRVERLREVIAAREKALEGLEIALPKSRGDITPSAYGKRKENISKLRDNLKKQERALQGLTKAQRESRRELQLLLKEIDEEEFQQLEALVNARTDLRSSRVADPAAQARIKLQSINRLIGRAIEVYGRNSEEVLNLLTERQNALADQTEAQLNRLESRLNLGIARRFGPDQDIGQARAELDRDKQLLAFMRSHANRFDPTEIIDLEAEIVDAEQQLAEDTSERAAGVRKALLEVAAARAEARGNDVGGERVGLRQAQLELREADTREERLSGRANVIRAHTKLRDARAQKRIENIEYEASLDRITNQQEIAAYERILRTQKLSIDTRKQLRQRIHQLQREGEEGDFDLDVGSIDLPTVYDIRRAIAGTVGGSPVAAYSQTNVTMHIYSNDGQKVGQEVNHLIRGSNKSARRNAGLVGT